MRAFIMIFAFTSTALLMGLGAWADGTMKLAGEVKKLSATTMEVSDGTHVYVIKKSAIKSKAVLAKSVKVGSQVEIEMHADGLLETKDAPPEKLPGAVQSTEPKSYN
jgi:hypothetical protein